MEQPEILIIGGGPAGLTSAIHLSGLGRSVVLIEKTAYPHHKVCGEYVSNEILPYLQEIGADPSVLSAVKITDLEFTFKSGKRINTVLPLGGFGISRYCFDQFLYQKALEHGCLVIRDQVKNVSWQNGDFVVQTIKDQVFYPKLVLGAFGKRSSMDIKLSRNFIQQKAQWLAVKGHYKGQHPDQVISLHQFSGGYCGVSKVEKDVINICYLTRYDLFKQYKNIKEHREKILYGNPALKAVFMKATPLFAEPLTISQVSFAHKEVVEEHMLMIGDTAGLIHPLCGNGMAMAIHAAKIASELCCRFLKGEIDRAAMEMLYSRQWTDNFRQRIKTGRNIASLLQMEKGLVLLTGVLSIFPRILPILIKKTHGKPLKINPNAPQYPV